MAGRRPRCACGGGRMAGRRRWEAWELTELRERWHLEDPAKLAAKLGRTVVALREKAQDLRVSAADGLGHYSLDEAAKALGVTRHTLWRLVKAGNARTIQGRHRHWLTVQEIERLEAVIRKDAPDGYILASEAARRLGYERSNLATLCRRRLMTGVKVRGYWYVPVAEVESIARDLAATGRLRADWVGRSPEHARYCRKMAEAKRRRLADNTLRCLDCKAVIPRRPGGGSQRKRCEKHRRSDRVAASVPLVCEVCTKEFPRRPGRGRHARRCGGCRSHA